MGNKATSVNIDFDRPKPAVYLAGETISGRVFLAVSKEITSVESICASLTCKLGFVHMQRGPTLSTGITQATSNENIRLFSQKAVLARPEFAPDSKNHSSNDKHCFGNKKSIQCGEYVFPFSIQLPTNLPPTINSENYPYIRYEFEVFIEKKWFLVNTDASVRLCIFPQANFTNGLNAESMIKFNGKKGDVVVKGFLTSPTLVFGQITGLELTIVNPMRLLIKTVHVCVIQRYQIGDCHRRLEVMRLPINSLTDTNEDHVTKTFPLQPRINISPTFQNSYDIDELSINIKVRYDLKIEIKFKGLLLDFDTIIPITVFNCSDTPANYDTNLTLSHEKTDAVKNSVLPSYDSLFAKEKNLI